MKSKWIAVFAIALVAADILQVAYAAPESAPSALAPESVPTTQLERAEVRGPSITVAHATPLSYPEFGAGSHQESLSTRTREEVKAEASERTAPAHRTYFNY